MFDSEYNTLQLCELYESAMREEAGAQAEASAAYTDGSRS